MRNRFPFFEANPDIVYLDSAATSQTLDTVIQDTNDFLLNHKANAHRSGHSMGAWVDSRYHNAKKKIGEWLNISNPENRIIFNSGASQGLYDAIQLIGQKYSKFKVLVGKDFHHSLLLPFRNLDCKIEYIDITSEGNIDYDMLEQSLIDNNMPTVLAFSAVGNVLGRKLDLDKIRNLANTYNSVTLIDACQSMGKVDYDYNGFDFVTWSWHKVYGPMGLGCLLIDEQWLEFNPVHPGGGSVTQVNLDSQTYLNNATKFESGTQNLQAIITLPNLLDWLIENQKNILEHDKKLVQLANSLCTNKIFNTETGLISFTTTVGTVEDYAMLLDASNICIRGGKLCAEPLVNSVAPIGSLLRVSWGAYTTEQELEFAFEKIGEVSERISRYV
jgi:cysteine desulfurase/selenocysteine lyase